MKKVVTVVLALAVLLMGSWAAAKSSKSAGKTVYGFKVKDIDNKPVKLSKYKGKVLLIVNVASKCGFTPQYAGLEKLYQKYKDKGLVILGFPCNQFGGQEPGTAKEIKEFCKTTYGVTFPLFHKIDVNGSKKTSLYKYLETVFPGDIGWNFTKFLVDRKGVPIKRFASDVKPEDLEKDIAAVLEQK
jgi:glutathione peroxidase